MFIDAPEPGSIYINGNYTGLSTPNKVKMPNGSNIVGVGLTNSRTYLRKEVTVDTDTNRIDLTSDDKVKPNKWRALFVGVPIAVGVSENGKCQTRFTTEELDLAYEFFKLNMREHIEPFSYGTVEWEIERQDLTKPVELHHNKKNDWYTLEAEQGLEELEDVNPGDYDNIFLFWRAEQNSCSFESSYFGLAWLEPTSEKTKKTGYVTVKFNPLNLGVKGRIEEYLREDPGVWTHEWLHVVVEKFYPEKGIQLPIPPKDKLILHAAEAYGYEYPWIDWYKDLISGQIPFGKRYRGIGPEALLHCNIRQAVRNEC